MASEEVVGKRMHLAQERALAIVQEHGTEERRENLAEATFSHIPNPRTPQELAQFQAELLAGLAELVEDQGRRISELEKASGKAAKKTTKK